MELVCLLVLQWLAQRTHPIWLPGGFSAGAGRSGGCWTRSSTGGRDGHVALEPSWLLWGKWRCRAHYGESGSKGNFFFDNRTKMKRPKNRQLQIEQRHADTNCSGRFSLACALRTNAHAPYRPGRCGPHLIALAPLLRGVRGRLPLLTTFNSIKLHTD